MVSYYGLSNIFYIQFWFRIYLTENTSAGDKTASGSVIPRRSSNQLLNYHTPASALYDVNDSSSVETTSAMSGENICGPVFPSPFFMSISNRKFWFTEVVSNNCGYLFWNLSLSRANYFYLIWSHMWSSIYVMPFAKIFCWQFSIFNSVYLYVILLWHAVIFFGLNIRSHYVTHLLLGL